LHTEVNNRICTVWTAFEGNSLSLRVCVRACVCTWVWIWRQSWKKWKRRTKNVTILICDLHFSGLYQSLTVPILFKLIAIKSLYSCYIIKVPLDFLLRLEFLKYFNQKFIRLKTSDKLLGNATSRTMTLNVQIQFFM